jgi:hypothetical protein
MSQLETPERDFTSFYTRRTNRSVSSGVFGAVGRAGCERTPGLVPDWIGRLTRCRTEYRRWSVGGHLLCFNNRATRPKMDQ